MSAVAAPGSARARQQEEANRSYFRAGAALALTGISHFVAPSVFRGPTGLLFPDDPARAVRINGASETVIGTAIAIPATRTIGLGALGVYGMYLATSATKALRRRISRSREDSK